MKKLVSIMMAATMLCATPVYAANVDLDSMTIEELVELRNQVETMILEKLGGESAINNGVYKVGTDIKAGNFSFTNTGDSTVEIYIYQDEDTYLSDKALYTTKNALKYVAIDKDETADLVLAEEQILRLDGAGMIQETQPSWAP